MHIGTDRYGNSNGTSTVVSETLYDCAAAYPSPQQPLARPTPHDGALKEPEKACACAGSDVWPGVSALPPNVTPASAPSGSPTTNRPAASMLMFHPGGQPTSLNSSVAGGILASNVGACDRHVSS